MYDAPATPLYPTPPVPGPRPAGRVLHRAVVTVSALIVALEVIEAALAFPAAEEYAAAIRSGTPLIDVLTPYDVLATGLLALWLAALVVTGLFLLQQRRFAESVQPHMLHARARWWAFGGWVVPIVNFWFPYQYVRDVVLALSVGDTRRRPLLRWWWGIYLLYEVVSQVGSNLALSAEDPRTAQLLGPIEVVSAGLAATAGVLWWRVLRSMVDLSGEYTPGSR